MIYKSTREEVKAYFNCPDLNQSEFKLLKDASLVDYNISKSKNNSNDSVPVHFRQGGAVDILLTGTKEEFNAEYFVSDAQKLPSETIMNIMDYAFEKYTKELHRDIEIHNIVESFDNLLKQTQKEDIEPSVLLGANKFKYFDNRKDDSRVASALKDGWEYFQTLIQSYGKTIIPQDMYENVKAVVSSLKNSPRTAKYFKEEYFKDNPNLDIYYQKIIYFTFKGFKCKAMLDILIVDKSNKDCVLFIPVDIKTMAEPVLNFPANSRRFRYDVQAAWYKIAILHSELIVELNKANRDYKLTNFKFLVETTSPAFRNKAVVFSMSNDLLTGGMVGVPEIRNKEGRILKPAILGVQQMLNIYKYHSERNDFKNEKILADYPEEIPFDWDFSKFTYEWS